MKSLIWTQRILFTALAAVLLAACGGGGGNSGSGTGQLSLFVTDAPVANADKVVVSFTGVTIKPKAGNAIEFQFDEIRQIDLLALRGSLSEILLEPVTVPAGEYEWIRLHVISNNRDYSYILIDDDAKPLRVPSGDQTGLKLVSGFSVPEDGHVAYTIDFDLMKAVTCPPGQQGTCFLRPALRLVPSALSGDLAGSIHRDVIASAQGEREVCFPAVYVYDAEVTQPADVGGPDERAPLTTTVVEVDEVTGLGAYEVGFLPPGYYLPVFTCDADRDDPDVYDNETEIVVRLLEGGVVEVIAGETTVYNFE